MNKKQKMFGTGKHRKMIVAGAVAGMTMVSGLFAQASNLPDVSGEKTQTTQTQIKQKSGVKKIFHTQDPKIQESIENNNYAAFVSLTNNQITKEQFENLVKKYNLHTSIKNAIENNNYRDFQLATSGTDLQLVSEEEFEEMVAKSIARKTGL